MSAEAVFQVEGMTCGACTASITNNLKQLPGVSDVMVSLLTEEAKVTYDPTLQTPQDFVNAIEDSGFGATEIRSSEVPYVTIINILGMTCGACSASLTEALLALPGVELVSISLVTETGRIKHSPKVTTDQIITAVEDCGFDAVIELSKPAKSESGSDQNSSYTTTVSISGMTCGSCVASVTEALKSNPNISNAVVSLITEEGSIQHSGEIAGPEIVEIIENAGFDAAVISSLSDSAPTAIEEDEEVKLSIHGITPETDLSSLQYNIEAYLTSTPGVVSYELSLVDGDTEEDEDPELQQAHELSVTFNPHLLGIRQLVDGLAAINTDLYFTILNSVDQSSAFQLKVLSRIKEIQYWKFNFTKSLIFGIPVLVLSNTQELSIWRDLRIFPGFYWVSLLQLVITVHVYFNLCKIFNKKFVLFVKNKGKNATMDVLVCISTSVSFIFSILSIVLSVWLGQTEKPPKLLFDTVCMLVGFISFGKWLENSAKGGTSTALSKLLSLTPTNCTIISDTTRYEEFLESQKSAKSESMIDLPSRTVSIDLIQTDDIAIVLPGGKVPADGTIVYGESEIDESLITGESLPIFKKKADRVIGGSINGPGLIHIKVVTSGKKSQLQQIINLVRESQINKAPSQGFADYVAARFVPGVIFLSTLTFTFWTIVCWVNHPDSLPMVFRKDDNGKFFVCLKLAISVVVVACPCALGLAAPTAIMVGTGVGASHGVLIKGGDILEKASSINVILFDKTGTLTTGNMKTNKYKMEDKLGLSQADWWTLIGSVEASSEHPIGRAIVKASKEYLGLTFEEDTFNTRISEFKAHAGLGVEAVVQLENGQSHEISIGNERMIKQMYSDLYEKSSQLNLNDDRANTVAYIIIDNQYCGYIELEDEIKPNAKEVLDYIRYVEGYQVGIVTGDNHKAASKIGKALGIPDCSVFSEVTPVNKDKVIVELKERLGGDKNVGIAFIGDGINDAPALVQADIGMAMSSGTDVAIESADVVLIGNSGSKSDLVGVLNALKISNATFSRIKLNFIWAAIYNLIMLPFAMGCFLPINLMLPPIFAGAAMAFSSVSVVINSLMLKRYQGPSIEKSSVRYDLEQELGEFDQFSLKTGSLIEFNQIKRNRNARYNIKAALKRIWRGRRSGGNYELLSS